MTNDIILKSNKESWEKILAALNNYQKSQHPKYIKNSYKLIETGQTTQEEK